VTPAVLKPLRPKITILKRTIRSLTLLFIPSLSR
jgi:hypothetical protein